MGSTALRRAATTDADIVARLDGLAMQLAAIEARLALLERSRPDRDEADATLRRMLPASTRQLPFATAELLRHANVDEDLRRALLAADIDSASSAGVWLRDRSGTQDGVAIVRLPGRRWQALQVNTYVSAQDSNF